MARSPRKSKQTTQAENLLQALSFVEPASKRDGIINTASGHVRMSGGYAVAFDGQISAGHPIEAQLTLCPQVAPLMKALKTTGARLVLAETAANRLSVKGEKLTALVPCLLEEDLPPAAPDPMLGPIDNRLREAVKACSTLSSENGTRVIEASVLIDGPACTGTNGAAILQVWHGNNLPMGLVVPKLFCKLLADTKANIVGFGATFSFENVPLSFTVHLEGGAWLRTVCYGDRWPSLEKIWMPAAYQPLPEGLFEGIDAVEEYNGRGTVCFCDNAVQSHFSAEIGAQYEVKGLQGGKAFNGKLLKQVSPYVDKWDYTTHGDRLFFVAEREFGPIRGAVMAMYAGSQD